MIAWVKQAEDFLSEDIVKLHPLHNVTAVTCVH